ncbi:MAG: UDP-N-acetylmuramoyl-tripeptide--D-alanyl-D-alanine ligase [Bacteroidia bacterium]
MSVDELYKVFNKHPLVCTDTRNIEPGCLFFALKGPNFNANKFAADAIGKGASYAVIDEKEYKTGDRFILVDDVLATLQQLAKYHRQQLNIPVIAIVGSNGKTTTKELITSVLSQKYMVLATPGNFNNHIGLPITLLKLKKEHRIAIIEMGANHIGENALLCEITCPNLGIITNNGKDHLEGFGSMEGVERSNGELYDYLLNNHGLAFVNANDAVLMKMAARFELFQTYAGNTSTARSMPKADVVGVAKSLRPEIEFSILKSEISIRSCLSGEYNFDNIIAAVAFGKYFGLSDEEIKKGIEMYEPKNNRSQILKKEKNTIYLDAYNANPSSMEASLRNFAAMPFENKIAIIGDMFELGKYAEEEHQNMINLCNELKLDEVIFVGDEFYKQKIEIGFHFFKTTEEAIEFIKQKNYSGKNFFMKGSRGMKLETIADVIK